MAILKYDTARFIESLEPGISVIVLNAFKKKLDDKINNIINEIHKELCDELPSEIKGRIHSALEMESDTRRIHVEVDIRKD